MISFLTKWFQSGFEIDANLKNFSFPKKFLIIEQKKSQHMEPPRGQCYKTFFACDLQVFVLS